MVWLGWHVSAQPYLPVQTKQIIAQPGEEKWITLYYRFLTGHSLNAVELQKSYIVRSRCSICRKLPKKCTGALAAGAAAVTARRR